mmetsp:Transcript_11615/g.16387  ORF Transcript_11615/g.16387 Transcript_11615/m.16387 type:complete len:863 (+) Transcript_11615:215-2803(+)
MKSNGDQDNRDQDGKGGYNSSNDDLKKKDNQNQKSDEETSSKVSSDEKTKASLSARDTAAQEQNMKNSAKHPVTSKMKETSHSANLHSRNAGRSNNIVNGDDDDGSNSDGSFIQQIEPRNSATNDDMIKSGGRDNRGGSNDRAPGAYEVEGRGPGSIPEWARRPNNNGPQEPPRQLSSLSSTSHTDNTGTVRFAEGAHEGNSNHSQENRRNVRGSIANWLSFRREPSQDSMLDSGVVTAQSVSDAVPIVYPDLVRSSSEIDLEEEQQRKRHHIKWCVSMVLVLVLAVALVSTCLTLLTSRRNKKPTPLPSTSPSTFPSISPSLAPTMFCDESYNTTASNVTVCLYNELNDMLDLSISDNTSCGANNLALWWLAEDVSQTSKSSGEDFLNDDDVRDKICREFKGMYDCLEWPLDDNDECFEESDSEDDNTDDGEKENDLSVNKTNSTRKESGYDLFSYFSQRYALAAMYYSLNGRDWTNNNGWLNHSKSICDWYGVRCNLFMDKVFSLDLKNNNMDGSFPMEISRLTKLRFLNLESNLITGSLPSSLWQDLELLRYVHFRNNLMTGMIPDVMNFTGVIVDVFKTEYTKTCAENNPSLNMSNVLAFLIEKLPDVSNETVNETLICKTLNGGLANPTAVRNIITDLTQKDRLLLVNAAAHDLLFRNAAHSIHYFDLSNNKFKGNFPHGLGLNSNLRHFDISHNDLTGEVRADDFFSINISFPRLDVLNLSGNRLNGTISSWLMEVMGDLEVYDFSSNELIGSIPTHVGLLSELREFNIGGNLGLNGTIPSELSQLLQLERLNLSGTSLTGDVPDVICDEVGYYLFSFDVDCNAATNATSKRCQCCTNKCWRKDYDISDDASDDSA